VARIVTNQSYGKRREDKPILSSYVINIFHTDLPFQHSPEPVTLKTKAAGFSSTLKQTDYLTSFEAYSCCSSGEVQGPSMLGHNDISFKVLHMKTLTDTKAEKNRKSSYISGHFK
jgi:hypothetical protein